MQDGDEYPDQRTFWRFSRPFSVRRKAVPDSFSIRELGAVIAKTLSLAENDSVEIKIDRTDRNRILVVRIPQETAK
jgi:hypothetical protein